MDWSGYKSELEGALDRYLDVSDHRTLGRRLYIDQPFKDRLVNDIFETSFPACEAATQQLATARKRIIRSMIEQTVSWRILYQEETDESQSAWAALDEVSVNAYQDTMLVMKKVIVGCEEQAVRARALHYKKHRPDMADLQLIAELRQQRGFVTHAEPLQGGKHIDKLKKGQCAAPYQGKQLIDDMKAEICGSIYVSSQDLGCLELALEKHERIFEGALEQKESSLPWNILAPLWERMSDLRVIFERVHRKDLDFQKNLAPQEREKKIGESAKNLCQNFTVALAKSMLAAAERETHYMLN